MEEAQLILFQSVLAHDQAMIQPPNSNKRSGILGQAWGIRVGSPSFQASILASSTDLSHLKRKRN